MNRICDICMNICPENEQPTKLNISWDRGSHGRYQQFVLCQACYSATESAIAMALSQLKHVKRSERYGESYDNWHEGINSENDQD